MIIDVRELMTTGLSAQEAFERAFDLCRADQVVLPNSGLLPASGRVYVPSGVYTLHGAARNPTPCPHRGRWTSPRG